MANDKPEPHRLVIPNMSGKILSDLLQSNGWTRGASDIITAGNILDGARVPERIPSELFVPSNPDKPGELSISEASLKTWGDTELTLELTEKEREVCRFVIEHFAKQGKIPPSRYSFRLLTAFKFD
jgi:hypothetical protein